MLLGLLPSFEFRYDSLIKTITTTMERLTPKSGHQDTEANRSSAATSIHTPTSKNPCPPIAVVQWQPPKNLPHVVALAKEIAKLENPMLDGLRPEREMKERKMQAVKAAELRRDHREADRLLDGIDVMFGATLNEFEEGERQKE